MPNASNALVKAEGPLGSLAHSQVQSGNPKRARLVFQKSHCPPSPTAVTISLDEIKFVHEGIASEPFEAIAEAEHCISDGRVTIEDDPSTTEVRIFEKRD